MPTAFQSTYPGNTLPFAQNPPASAGGVPGAAPAQAAPNSSGAQSPGFFGNDTYQPNPANFQIPGSAFFTDYITGQLGVNGQPGVGGRAAPQLDPSQQGQFRGQQQALASMLAAQARGVGPSLAQGQFQQSTDRNLAQALALSQAAGPNGAGALRNVAYQRGAISQQAAADSGQLRLQEQMQARGQLGQLLGNARGQDLGLASDNAQLQAGQNQMNQQALQYYLSQGMSLAQAQAQAAIAMEQIRAGAFSSSAGNSIGRLTVGAGASVAGAGLGALAAGGLAAFGGGGPSEADPSAGQYGASGIDTTGQMPIGTGVGYGPPTSGYP